MFMQRRRFFFLVISARSTWTLYAPDKTLHTNIRRSRPGEYRRRREADVFSFLLELRVLTSFRVKKTFQHRRFISSDTSNIDVLLVMSVKSWRLCSLLGSVLR